MKNGRPGKRIIIIRHNGGADYAEVLFYILRHYAENADRARESAGTAAAGKAGDCHKSMRQRRGTEL